MGGGEGALESRVDFGGVGGGGWHKRKNLQISDVQRLASLGWGGGGTNIDVSTRHVIKDSFTNIDVSTRDKRQLQNK